eukprot:97773_1
MGNYIQKNKPDDEKDQSDDDVNELLVTGDDGREPIYDFPKIKKTPIIHCVGQIKCHYRIKAFSRIGYGTGTIFKVEGQHAYVLTAAHNTRALFKQCPHCKEAHDLKSVTCTCGSKQKLVKTLFNATDIEFIRLGITENDCGKIIDRKQCEVAYVDDVNYRKYNKPCYGYDIMILQFKDNSGFYNEYTKNIRLESYNPNISINHVKSFRIFGFPFDKYEQHNIWGLYGMRSVGKDFQSDTCEETRKHIFKQRSVDTFKAQSGSAIYYQDEKSGDAVIFAVHCGGIKSEKCNVGTFIECDYFSKPPSFYVDDIDVDSVMIRFYEINLFWKQCEIIVMTQQQTKKYLCNQKTCYKIKHLQHSTTYDITTRIKGSTNIQQQEYKNDDYIALSQTISITTKTPFNVIIENFVGKREIICELAPNSTIAEVKQKVPWGFVSYDTGNWKDIKLIYKKVYCKNDRALSDYKYESGATIFVRGMELRGN